MAEAALDDVFIDDIIVPAADRYPLGATLFLPRLMSEMVDAALAGRFEEARAAHFRLLPLMDVNFIESSPGPVKAAMALMGLLEENLRLPLVPVMEKTRARVREVISELGLLEESAHVSA